MQQLVAVLQVKSRRPADFKMFLDWYAGYVKCDKIIIIDDNSLWPIKNTVDEYGKKYPETEILVFYTSNFTTADYAGINAMYGRQVKHCNLALRLANVAENDLVLFPDEDEFWWATPKAHTFKQALNIVFSAYECNIITVPWILMSSKIPMKSRNDSDAFCDCFNYAAPGTNNEVKFVLKYNKLINIDCIHLGMTTNHRLLIQDKPVGWCSAASLEEKMAAPLRCYHFRMTTEQEYNAKMMGNINNPTSKRCYVGNKTFYNFDKSLYPSFTGYTVMDNTVSDIIKRLR